MLNCERISSVALTIFSAVTGSDAEGAYTVSGTGCGFTRNCERKSSSDEADADGAALCTGELTEAAPVYSWNTGVGSSGFVSCAAETEGISSNCRLLAGAALFCANGSNVFYG